MTMLPSRRALLCHANSFRYNYVCCLSSTSNKDQGAATPEDLSKLYRKSESAGEVDIRGSRERRLEQEESPRETVADMAKEGVVGAMETGVEVGKAAKQTVDGMLDAAKKTTESVKDSVSDDTDTAERRRLQRHEYENGGSDKFAEDLRRRAGG